MATREQTITTTLTEALAPVHLEVVNESHMHSVKPGSETHFKVIVVTPEFAGQSLVARHRRVNELLASELKAGLHALSIHAFAPDQWTDAVKDQLSSPACRGGAGK
jgi:BolA protein